MSAYKHGARLAAIGLLCGGLLAGMLATGSAQPPAPKRGGPQAGASTAESFVARMMTLDKDGDGKITRSEVTDKRLFDLLNRADANRDNSVTKEELQALFARESTTARTPGSGPRGPGSGGPAPGGLNPEGPGGKFAPPGKRPPGPGAPPRKPAKSE